MLLVHVKHQDLEATALYTRGVDHVDSQPAEQNSHELWHLEIHIKNSSSQNQPMPKAQMFLPWVDQITSLVLISCR